MAPRRSPRPHGGRDDGARLHAVARHVRGGQAFLHQVHSRGRGADEGRGQRFYGFRFPQVAEGFFQGRNREADRVLQREIRTIAVCRQTRRGLPLTETAGREGKLLSRGNNYGEDRFDPGWWHGWGSGGECVAEKIGRRTQNYPDRSKPGPFLLSVPALGPRWRPDAGPDRQAIGPAGPQRHYFPAGRGPKDRPG